jgi:phycocyanobilin lyase beta subunit
MPEVTITAPLIAALEQADSSTALLTATQALAAAAGNDQAAITTLVQVLGFNNPGAAVAAVDGLIAIGPAAVDPLLRNLDVHNYGARAWAVRALAGIGDVRGLELLEQALADDIGASVRRAAARGLGQLQLHGLEGAFREAVIERCLRALEVGSGDDEWVVRYAVVVGMESLSRTMTAVSDQLLRTHSALSELAAEAGEPTPVVRLRAALALRRLP